MRKILAVSGGVDSVVMLHLFKNEDEAPIVAHFNHGIRENAGEDAAFVERLARGYGLQFELGVAQLGEECGEADARSARYDFLRSLAKKYDGIICVAHHRDDVIESVAINCLRGTGWRGLAPMSARDIERPLIGWSKKEIYRYAAENGLSFRQDQTNTDDNYLRNRVREKMLCASETDKEKLVELYQRQTEIVSECDELLADICVSKNGAYSRALINDDSDLAQELLRYILLEKDIRLTRPQLEKCAAAIRDFAPGKKLSLDREHFLAVGKFSFSVI